MQSAASRTHRKIRPPAGVIALNWLEVWEFRDLLVTLAIRDVRLRYRQTALGVLWVVLQPLIAAGIFTFIFNRVAGLHGDGTPYFAFCFAGQVAWMAFSSTLNKSSVSLVQNASLVSKVFFPRLVLPLSTTFSSVIDFAVGMTVIVCLAVFYHLSPFWGLVTLPLWLLLLVLLGVGVGLISAAVMVRYRDVVYIVPVVLQFLLYASPVGMSLSEIRNRLGEPGMAWYLICNPLAPLIEAFRWALFGKGVVPWIYVGYASVMTLVIFCVGVIVFRSEERRFADII